MKDRIILICGDIGVGTAITNKLNSIGFNDVVITEDVKQAEIERGISINFQAPVINDYIMPFENAPVDYNKQKRKGGKKNKKNWRY